MKVIKRFLLTCIIIVVLVVAYFVNEGYQMYKNAINEISIENKVQEIKSQENYTYYTELPEQYIHAVIAVEDSRFFKHGAVDGISIIRAILVDIKSLELKEGGSTITQQLAKNIYFTQEKKFTRKIAEIFMAVEIEKNCSKEEIFEMYVNTSYFGDGYYCVKDASNGYFDKNPIDMNLYESSLLAGIPNAPSVYAPTKNPDLARQRQAQVLRKMVKNGYLSQDEANQIINSQN